MTSCSRSLSGPELPAETHHGIIRQRKLGCFMVKLIFLSSVVSDTTDHDVLIHQPQTSWVGISGVALKWFNFFFFFLNKV